MTRLFVSGFVKWFVIAVIALSAVLELISRSEGVMPARLEIHFNDGATGYLKFYFNSGRGFHEQEVAVARLHHESAAVWLPLGRAEGLRLDFEGEVPPSVRAERLCVRSLFGKHCWRPPSLNQLLIPRHSIEKSADGMLTITGGDPHLTIHPQVLVRHYQLSRLSSSRIAIIALLGALTLATAVTLNRRLLLLRRFRSSIGAHWRRRLEVDVAGLSGLFVIACFIVGGFWSGIYELGSGVVSLIALLVALIMIPSGIRVSLAGALQKRLTSLGTQGAGWNGAGIALVLCLPVAALMILTWQQEFPHIGDHQYHTWANISARQFFNTVSDLYLITLLLIVAALASGFFGTIAAVLLVVMLWWSWHVDIPGIFTRYPASARFLTWPLAEIAHHFHWPMQENAGRLMNALALPVWLLVLRPLMIGRWPDRRILLIGLALFTQTEVVYFFTSVYIDAWAVVFVLLAVEIALLSKVNNGALKACLLLGFGATIKEPLVFLVPWFWFAARPWRMPLKEFLLAVRIGLASVLPFIVYFLVRKDSGFSRYDYQGLGQIFSVDWISEFAYRTWWHFGTSGLLLIALLLILWGLILFTNKLPADRFKLTMIGGAIVSLMLLFNLDMGGYAFTGYPRFYLPVLVLFGAPLFLLATSARLSPVALSGIVAIILAANLPVLAAYLEKATGPDAQRNFTEHYDAPIFLPIKALIGRAEQDGRLQPGDPIVINHVTGWNQPVWVYFDLKSKYQIEVREQLVCRCSSENPVVLAPFVYPGGLNAGRDMTDADNPGHPRLPKHSTRRWSEVISATPACISRLRQSCAYTTEQQVNGSVTGILGVLDRSNVR